VLADELLGMVVNSGQHVYLQPFDFRQLHLAGLWSPGSLVREIEQRKFPLILIDQSAGVPFSERWSPELMVAIEATYEAHEQWPGMQVYRPRLPSMTAGR
jgi:hypothetical protein